LADGVAQLSSGIRQLDAAAPDSAKLAPLAEGSTALAEGSAKLASGLEKLADGVDDAAKKAGLLGAGLKQVSPKVREAAKGAGQIAAGNKGVAEGVASLAAGNGMIKSALDTMSSKLPSASDLASLKGGAAAIAQKNGELAAGVARLSAGAKDLANGAKAVSEGAQSLAGGIDLVRDKLPSSMEGPGGDPEGLAASVAVVEEVAAPVANNGQAFAPYSISISLWIGMLMASFIFNFISLPSTEERRSRAAVARSRAAIAAQKLGGPALLVLAQAALLFIGIEAMGMSYAHRALVFCAALAAGLCDLAVIFCLNALLGDAGKLLSVILLVVQIGASGGSFPIELSPGFFRAVHDYLPVSDAVTALRFGMAGAYEGRYWTSLLRLGATALVFIGLVLLAKPRWERDAEGSGATIGKTRAARGDMAGIGAPD
jgi:YhgE/Pip C-terminal domain